MLTGTAETALLYVDTPGLEIGSRYGRCRWVCFGVFDHMESVVVVIVPALDLEGGDGHDPDGDEDTVGDDVGAELLRDGEAQEDVADGQQDRRAANVVVVPVPEPPHLGRLVRPRQDRCHLFIHQKAASVRLFKF